MSSGSGNFRGIKITANICFCCHAVYKRYQCWLMLDLYWYTAFLRQETLSSRMSSQRRINTRNSKKSQGAVAIHVHVLASCEVQGLWICDFDVIFVHMNHVCTLRLCDVVSVLEYQLHLSSSFLRKIDVKSTSQSSLSLSLCHPVASIIDIATLLLNINTITDYHTYLVPRHSGLCCLKARQIKHLNTSVMLLSKAVYRIWKRRSRWIASGKYSAMILASSRLSTVPLLSSWDTHVTRHVKHHEASSEASWSSGVLTRRSTLRFPWLTVWPSWCPCQICWRHLA